MTARETIAELRQEVARLRRALAVLVADDRDELDGYSRGWADGAAGRPVGSIDPQVLAMGERISARLTGTETPRHLRPVPTSPA